MTDRITEHVVAWVDRDIATGVLAAAKREERIARRVDDHKIDVTRHTTPASASSFGPTTRVIVRLMHGFTPVSPSGWSREVSYSAPVASDVPLDAEDLTFIEASIAALRRDFRSSLPVRMGGVEGFTDRKLGGDLRCRSDNPIPERGYAEAMGDLFMYLHQDERKTADLYDEAVAWFGKLPGLRAPFDLDRSRRIFASLLAEVIGIDWGDERIEADHDCSDHY